MEDSDESQIPPDSRYYWLPGGCFRGDRCFYAHDRELHQTQETTEGASINGSLTRLQVGKMNSLSQDPENLARKIFVGGLSPSVESDDLREFFEANFGPVLDAAVVETHDHLGDQTHSRGFGFVTFEKKESAVSAVQAHFVNIYGKKVEIKSVVPRLGPQLLIAKGSAIMPTQLHEISRDSPTPEAVEQRQLLDVTTDVQARVSESDISPSLNDRAGKIISTTALSCSPRRVAQGRLIFMPTFMQWLPKFLMEVYSRLKEGEWYPLSALKGDFRATCGLELDHEAIGFSKLSDFLRWLPYLCRIKIVPLGNGPATLMVLLPARMTTVTSHQIHDQEVQPNAPRTESSLFEAARTKTYAAATRQGLTLSSGSSSVSCESIAAVDSADNNVNNLPREQVVAPPIELNADDYDGLVTNFLQSTLLVENTAGKENWNPGGGPALTGQTAGFKHHSCLRCMNSLASCTCYREFATRHRSKVEDPSSSFVSAPPTYANMFPEPNVHSSPATSTSTERSSAGNNLPEESTYEDSFSRGIGNAPSPVQNLFLPPSRAVPKDSDRNKVTVSGVCYHNGCQRKAIWMAFPCKHLALCSTCRDTFYMYWGKANFSSCPVCFDVVETWYAVYH